MVVLLAGGCEAAGGESPDAEGAAQLPAGSEGRVAPPFDAERAHTLLVQQVNFGPRIPGTAGHARQLAWMRDYLRQRSDTVIVQSFTHRTSGGKTLLLRNVFARFRPEQTQRVLLVAHWDTRPQADQSTNPVDRARPVPGANDGASGVAVLLQLAELFRRQPPPIGVDLLLVDGEDFGPGTEDMFLGARHFARNQPPGYAPLYGVLLDMIADRDPRFPIEGYSQQHAPEVIERVWGMAERLGYGDRFLRVDEGGVIEDDHIPLNEGGIRTIDIIDFEYGPGNRYWHTPEDVPANTAPLGLRLVGETLAEMIYRGG